jgi:carbonic anhydrase
MPVIDQLLESNRKFAQTFDKGDLPMPPARALVVLTCMDARSTRRSSWVLRSETLT